MRLLISALLPGLLLFLKIISTNAAAAAIKYSNEITCAELKSIAVVGSFLTFISSAKRKDVPLNFYMSTRGNREPIEVVQGDWSGLELAVFDPARPTYVVIHGFKSGGRKSWVLELKDRLLDTADANIILVDWSHGSNTKNYVNAARNTRIATNKIFNFLQGLRAEVEKTYKNASKNNIQYNRLYFIGHSLGAQISGQVAALLKEDAFWRIDRITGLDPAKPCFVNVENDLRLDKDDAYFVDIIHTQIGNGEVDALGLKDSIGHIDFYVNGGIVQPECVGTWLTPKWDTMICSHKLSYKYFTESLKNDTDDSCHFPSYRWDGSYLDAQTIFNHKLNGFSCAGCPQMGIDAPKSGERGIFLVITATKQPHCKFNQHDVEKVLKVIRRLKGRTSIFDKNAPDETILNINN